MYTLNGSFFDMHIICQFKKSKEVEKGGKNGEKHHWKRPMEWAAGQIELNSDEISFNCGNQKLNHRLFNLF